MYFKSILRLAASYLVKNSEYFKSSNTLISGNGFSCKKKESTTSKDVDDKYKKRAIFIRILDSNIFHYIN